MGWRQCRTTWQKSFAPSSFLSWEKSLKTISKEIEKLYKNTMLEYIFQGHRPKLSKTSWKNNFYYNYLSHHRDKNINKSDKIWIVFDAGAKIQYQSLNKHLLKGPDYLNNLGFLQRKYVVMVDITQMFYQVRVLPSDHNILRFLCTAF